MVKVRILLRASLCRDGLVPRNGGNIRNLSATGILRLADKTVPDRPRQREKENNDGVPFLALFPIRLTESAAADSLLSKTEPGSLVDLSQLCARNALANVEI